MNGTDAKISEIHFQFEHEHNLLIVLYLLFSKEYIIFYQGTTYSTGIMHSGFEFLWKEKNCSAG
jgi:hypothetical protein